MSPRTLQSDTDPPPTGLTSTVGNSIFVTVLRHRLKTISDGQTVLLLNTALCDLGISVTGYPYTTISSYAGRWIFGDVMCQMYGFLCFTLNQVQMNTLVVVAIFRYISICHPQFKHLLKPSLAKRCLIAVWLYGVAWSTPPLLGWSRYTKEPFETSCSTDWYDRSLSGIAYSICLVVFCYAVHVICLAICYQKILYKSRQLQLSLPETNPKLSLYGDDDINMMNIMMMCSFLMFWTPYAVCSIISIFKTDISTFWYVFPTVFAKTSCMMNPIIYGLSHKLLRRELLKLLRTCCCVDKSDDIRDLQETRKRFVEGTYDKEGIYVGKVRVGLCTCNGCVVGRREMAVLARLQKSPVDPSRQEEDSSSEHRNMCSITLMDDSPPSDAKNGQCSRDCHHGKNEDETGMVEVIMNPKLCQAASACHEPTSTSSSSSSSSGFKQKSPFKEDSDKEESVQISVTALFTKNTSKAGDGGGLPGDDGKSSREETVIVTNSTSSVITTDSTTVTQVKH
ncbi:rhodopsin, G0-coupled-like [Penaeus indicus]|uniref:rhodopsin, G0-coupled-like n=1 Tax=Penaeus indicus TaxID=29960 RepID=UPI00300CE193